MNTRNIIFVFLSVCIISISFVCGETKQKNVLLIIADDMNSWLLEDTKRYSGKVIAPHIQSLAKSGVNFVRAYTASPVCSPSRTAFLSGVAPWKSGHYHNALAVDQSQALKGALTLAGLFKQGGYSTYGYGKISHGWDQKEHWDEHIGHSRDPYPPNAPLTSVGKGEQDWGVIHLPEEEMNGTLMANHTINQLGKQHSKPFFLACGFFNPHMPWYVPEKYFDMFPLDEIKSPPLKEDDLNDVPDLGIQLTKGKSKFVESVFKAKLYKEAIRAYLATTAYVDTQVGRILTALDNSPYKDNTIVVFISDHGFHLAEKNHWQKATLWEEATHCLMMFRVPGITQENCISKRFVSLLDLYPTLAELNNLTPPTYLDGTSLLPLLKNPDHDWTSTAITGLCNKNKSGQPYLSIRNELGRYIQYRPDQAEFYDTNRDPHEWKNLENHPEYSNIINQYRKLLPNAITALPSAKVSNKHK